MRARQCNQVLEALVAARGGDVGTPPRVAHRHHAVDRFAQVDRLDVVEPQRLAVLGIGQDMLHVGEQRERHQLGELPSGRIARNQQLRSCDVQGSDR